MKMVDTTDEVTETKEAVKEVVVEKKNDVMDMWEITDIPSKYLLYPEGTKLFGRRLNVKEIKRLAQMDDSTMEGVMYDVLKSTIEGIDIDEIYRDDKLYLILWLRANSYREPGYSVDYDCPLCNEKSSFEFTINNLNVMYYDKNIDNTITMENGDIIVLDNIKIKDEKKIRDFKINHAKFKVDDDFLELAVMVRSINGQNLDTLSKYEYVTNKITPNDFSKIETLKTEISFGVNFLMDVTCDKCKGVSKTGVMFRKEFFIPKYRARSNS